MKTTSSLQPVKPHLNTLKTYLLFSNLQFFECSLWIFHFLFQLMISSSFHLLYIDLFLKILYYIYSVCLHVDDRGQLIGVISLLRIILQSEQLFRSFSAEPSHRTSSNLLISTPPTFTLLLILRSSKESKQEVFEKPKKTPNGLIFETRKKKKAGTKIGLRTGS